jgi:RNase P/RNase MRP subunit POP5
MAVKTNRKRYILFEIISNKEISLKMAEDAVFESSLRLLGELGVSEAKIMFLPEFWHKNSGVISANANYIPKIKTVLALIKKISGHDVIIKSIKVFGTLRKIKGEY